MRFGLLAAAILLTLLFLTLLFLTKGRDDQPDIAQSQPEPAAAGGTTAPLGPMGSSTDAEPPTPDTTRPGSGTTTPFVGTQSPIEAGFDQSSTSGYAPLIVHFTAMATSSSGGQIQNYAWTFGDGFEGAGREISHSYQATGTYAVRLVVSDSLGFESIVTGQIVVLGDEEDDGEPVDYVLDPGFEYEDNGFKDSYDIASVERSSEAPIEGDTSFVASFPGWSRVILPVTYPWREGPRGYSLTASARVRVDAISPGTTAQLCAVAYWSTSNGEVRNESCAELVGPNGDVVSVVAELNLDPQQQRNRVYLWLSYPHIGEAVVTLDEAHLVLDKVRDSRS